MTAAPRPRLLVRADASRRIGGGHVMRCRTLAGALAEFGWETALLTAAETLAVVPSLGRDVTVFHRLEDVAAAWPDGCDVAVIDHYGLRAGDETALRTLARRILVIDDLADRPHDCDLLLDQTFGRRADSYAPLVPAAATILTGSDFALLRPQFRQQRRAALEQRHGQSRRLLVSMGLTDPDNATGLVLDAIGAPSAALELDVVLGSASPHLDAVRHRLAPWGAAARLHVDVTDMAALMAGAHVAVGAAGTTSWERCCLGLPTLMLVLADNQRLVAEGLAAVGAAIPLGELAGQDPVALGTALRAALADPARLAAVSRAAARVCDGLGTRRVAAALAVPPADDGRAVTLRPVTAADSDLILAWQRHPETRRHFRTPTPPTADEHAAWMARRLADPMALFEMVMLGDVPAGLVRLDPVGPRGGADCHEVSILTAPECYRQGVGRRALALAHMLEPHSCLIAEVLPGNTASEGLFTRAGFVRVADGHFERRPIPCRPLPPAAAEKDA